MVQITGKKIPKSTAKTEQAEKVIKRLRRKTEEEQAYTLAAITQFPYIDLYIVPVDINDVRIIPEEDSKKYQLGVFYKSGKKINVAITDPYNVEAADYLAKIKEEKGLEIKVFVVSPSSLKKIWKKYQDNPLLETMDYFSLNLTGKDLEEFENKFADLLKLKERSDEIPTTEVINVIISGAVKMNASDIHFEPQKESVRMRYRIDGVLQDIGFFPHTLYKTILSRIKMLGKMKLNIRDIAQDGHFSIEIKNKKEETGRLDVRVSIIPGNNGESIVMRLLSQESALVQVEELGLQGLANERMNVQIAKPNGMVLVTGPTGSGKTTTLYAFVNKLNHPDVKIITIEDPIEYQIKGISQTQVAPDRGYTFEKGLRAIVRQDPDIVLVGEIRDGETAEIAVQAALTGHLVLSTLHTNNAVASVSRLIEMGIRPSLITSSVNAFIAQRLVRKLCPHCKEKYEPAEETIGSIKKIISMISPKARIEIPKEVKYLYKPVGCPKCNGLGYKGRIGIFEILTITENIEKLVLDMAGESELTEAALEDGMITMTQDGIVKTLQGLTSMEEVWRVTGQTTFLEDLYEKLMDQSLSRSIMIPDVIIKEIDKHTENFEKLNTFINSSSSRAVTEMILAAALLLGAGDIHIEPEEEKVKIRFRINGILQTITFLPLSEYPAFIGRIKLLSGLKTKVRAGVKDSRFSIKLEQPFKEIDESVDVRVSIISGGYGETVVLRLLNKSAVALDLESLGIRKQNMEKILREIEKPYGIVINTGPTGSGKTTTLYSLLSILNKPEVKIITVEDPIEYQLKGILQTQVNKKAKYDFATALRALLRQNPDIMMIGEIRDKETAEIAIQAALTGHLLLSTLHANDTASSPLRLINMGVRSDDLATAANAFIAQRLVRKLCPECKKPSALNEKDKAAIQKVLQSISPKAGVEIPKEIASFEPVGCPNCHNTGFIGRTTISEVLSVDSELENLIARNALSSEIKQKAIENGMITMTQDGILKVIEGETTLEEVKRVTEE